MVNYHSDDGIMQEIL